MYNQVAYDTEGKYSSDVFSQLCPNKKNMYVELGVFLLAFLPVELAKEVGNEVLTH